MARSLRRLLRGLLLPGSVRAREQQRWCTADSFPSGSYNFQLLRSRTDGDFVRYPDLLWSPNPYWNARAGLNAHVRELADRLGGTVYSDVVIVMHPSDHRRTAESMLESWADSAQRELADCFERLVATQGFVKAAPGRPLQVRFVADGGDELGVELGLEPGEFATAMLPNLYLGPCEGSAPLVEVFVAHGDKDSFSSVGTLWSDQLAFSVGAHPFDNHVAADLGDSAVYTVHRFPGESGLHHKLAGERAERLLLETGSAHGGQTVRVVDPGRDQLVLEVMLVAAREAETELPLAAERGGRVAGATDLPELPFSPLAGGEPGERTFLPEDLDLLTVGAVSILPDELPVPIHGLTQRSTLLPKVLFGKLMRGYTMDIDRGGTLSPRAADPVARFMVRRDRLSIVPLTRELAIDGRPARGDQQITLGGSEHTITWRGGQLEVSSLRRPDPRWPYVARVTTPKRTTPLAAGASWSIGRDGSRCDVPLPDRLTTANVLWREGGEVGDDIEVQGGRVPRARFRTDAICVASRAAELDLSGPTPRLLNPSTSCAVHVMRQGGEVVRVKCGGHLDLSPGDELLIGNALFVLASPGQAPAAPLVAAVLEPAALPERLLGGPGGRGRRPRAGGDRGRIVEPSRTYGAMLGMSPRGDRAPVAPAPPEPVEREIGDLEVLGGAQLATDCLPSLSLDPTAEWPANDSDGFLTGEAGDVPLAAAGTVAEENPGWFAALQRASQEPQTRVMEPPGPPPTPRGLHIPPRRAAPPATFKRRGASALPRFGLDPRARLAGSPPPSVPGD